MKLSKFLLFSIIVNICFTVAYSQKTSDLFMPKEIKKAYLNKTRSFDGKPGKNYFINKIDYKIIADFNPETRQLKGEEIITFKNNSKDTLKYLFFNLYQDIFKKGNSRDWDITGLDIHDGVEITKINFNNNEVELIPQNVSNRASILRLKLPQNILPGKSAEIKIDWNFILPLRIPIRMGTYGDKNFFIAYWFPKVAVYDDIEGWNTHGHSGNQEFYNDFGDYEVEFSVPGEYMVWSTGVQLNKKEIYSKSTLDKIEKSMISDSIVPIVTQNDLNEGNILNSAEKHTWKFKSKNTPDFALAVSKSYLWDGSSIKSGDRRIFVSSIYKQDTKDFHKVAELSKKSIEFFTNVLPAIPYPYPKMTAFSNGRNGGGMEFPGMINDGESENLDYTLGLTAHEIGHSYYPFYTGFNEQKYAWMDEGLISFIPFLVVQKYGINKDQAVFSRNIQNYAREAGSFNDVPLMISSDNVGRYAYRFHAYSRSSVTFYLLYQYLGKEMFIKGLNEFTKIWNGKHPTPYDLFFTYNRIAGEDLAWFWKPWFFELGAPDLSIESIDEIDKNTLKVSIKNKSGFPVPVVLKGIDNDGKVTLYEKPMNIWSKEGNIITIKIARKNLKEISLDTEMVPDVFPEDNNKFIK